MVYVVWLGGLFAAGFALYSKPIGNDNLSFVIGQRLWSGLISAVAITADYDKKQSLESPCLFAYI